jgi:hypothetical protein
LEENRRDLAELLCRHVFDRETEKDHKNLTQDSRYPDGDSKAAPPECKPRALIPYLSTLRDDSE